MNLKPQHKQMLLLSILIAQVSLAACSDDTDESSSNKASSTNTTTTSGSSTTTTSTGTASFTATNTMAQDDCKATEVEADSLVVSGVGSENGPTSWSPQFPPGAVVAMTYLRMQSSEMSQKKFQEVNDPVVVALSAPAEGLMGISTRFSPKCNVARTLTVWESEAKMMQFVMGEAHLNAMQGIDEISRGGSITDTWSADSFDSIGWDVVAKRFAEHDGPVY